MFTYENRQFLMDGKPYRILSGAIHYFRVVPEYWEDRLMKLKACGFNTVETYTCWNLHERKEGQFDFSGILDIERFIETAEKLELNVIVRPGPYICAEWELGGLPSWLLKDSRMGLRCADPDYLSKVRPYFDQLLSRIRPHLCTNGGRVIMLQVENEYGSYGDDKTYLREIQKIYRENGIDCMLFTSDGPGRMLLEGGTLPDVVPVVNFGSRPKEFFPHLRQFRDDVPLMCGEFWIGWFDHWYHEHHTRPAEDVTANLEEMFQCDASFNFYMFHGGTNFGFTNGANYIEGGYQPTVTSYDYYAPVSECGDLTENYYAVRDTIERCTGVKAPQLPVANLPKTAYGRVELTEGALLMENLKNLVEPVHAAKPMTMEQLGQDFGYVLYSATLRGPRENQELTMEGVHDRAIVYLDGKRIGMEERSQHKDEIRINIPEGQTAQLDILVENMGRINYGPKILDRKGILGGIRFNAQYHFGWDMYCLTMDDLSRLEWKPFEGTGGQPVFLRGSLKVEGTPCDTFLRCDDLVKGFCVVNGFNLGRYYTPAGPQKTLYVPAPVLHEGENEIIVFESDEVGKAQVEFCNQPDLG